MIAKASIFALAEMSDRHTLCQEDPWHSRGLRKMVIGNYTAFYIIDLQTDTVVVVRVLYNGSNIEKILEP